jgi:hypothetical protein
MEILLKEKYSSMPLDESQRTDVTGERRDELSSADRVIVDLLDIESSIDNRPVDNR